VLLFFSLGLFFFVLNSFERLLDTFCRLKLGSRRRAIKIAYCPWAIRENPASSVANQIARFIKTNACHIIRYLTSHKSWNCLLECATIISVIVKIGFFFLVCPLLLVVVYAQQWEQCGLGRLHLKKHGGLYTHHHAVTVG
jgi:uncharacterized integral membrane protein